MDWLDGTVGVIDDLLSASGRWGSRCDIAGEDAQTLGECLDLIGGGIEAGPELA